MWQHCMPFFLFLPSFFFVLNCLCFCLVKFIC
jgi:hypothetical protein